MPTPLVGMLLFIASEVMFFGGLFATYFNARATVGPDGWHPPEDGHLDLPLAAVLTAILIASSFTMQFGVWAIRRGDTGKLRMWTASPSASASSSWSASCTTTASSASGSPTACSARSSTR